MVVRSVSALPEKTFHVKAPTQKTAQKVLAVVCDHKQGAGEISFFSIWVYSPKILSSLKKLQMLGKIERPRRRSETYAAQGSEILTTQMRLFQ